MIVTRVLMLVLSMRAGDPATVVCRLIRLPERLIGGVCAPDDVVAAPCAPDMGPPALVARVPHVVVSSQALAPGCGTPPAIRRVQPEVAGRRDNDDACLDRAAGCEGGRIGVVRLEHARGDREIDHADVVDVPDRDRMVERGNHVADVPVVVTVEHRLV